jgi:hypothetical protein
MHRRDYFSDRGILNCVYTDSPGQWWTERASGLRMHRTVSPNPKCLDDGVVERVKGKVKLPLCLSVKYHTIKDVWWVEVQVQAYLTSALDGSSWSVSHPATSFPGKGCTVSIGLEAGLAPEPVWTRCRRKRFLSLKLPEIEPRSSSS